MALAQTEALARIEEGYRLLDQGEPQRALDRFLDLAESLPGIAASWHGLGNACAAAGDPARSLEFLAKACSIAPQTGLYWGDYGRQLLHAQRFAEAAEAFSRALRDDRENLLLHMMYGQALSGMGLEAEALSEYQYVLERQPQSVPTLNLVGNVLRKLGRLEEAAEIYQASLRMEPRRYEVWHNLAVIRSLQQRWPEATACAAEAVHLNPQFWQAQLGLGLTLLRQKMYDDAEACYLSALQLSNGDAEVCLELGNLAMARHQGNQAMQWFHRAIEANPHHVGALINAADLFRLNGGITQSLTLARLAQQIEPDHPKAIGVEAIALSELGRMREALECYQRVLSIDPQDGGAQSNLLYNLNFHTAFEPRKVFALHQAWGKLAEAHVKDWGIVSHTIANPAKRLRVGYVSGDFRRHSVMYFLRPLLEGHQRDQFEIYCYSCVDREDGITAQVKQMDVVWRDIAALSHPDSAALIVRDKIDILVDLGGHTGSGRLPVFAAKPAPIQCSYLGYPNTSGLTTIDYRIVDPVSDPEDGPATSLHTEALARLHPTFLCFDPVEAQLPVSPRPPVLEQRYITFGTFNNNKKIDVETAHAWGRLLLAVPGSRLLLKCRSYGAEEARRHVLGILEQAGVSPDRVTLLPGDQGYEDHLRQYARLDIALDTFPYNGTTTTMEALWMGVPVISLSGQTHASRVGRSILNALGCPEWVAASAEDFARIGAALATNPPELQRLRLNLRQMLGSSALMDRAGMVQRMETFYRQAWQAWCARQEMPLPPAA
ncbi:MAG: tetratricopeptide repeat protein [Bryobacterales bacterium]|jgi:predicted O-linked N-acetylglucosamine transferase (SPINDLY family)|nr:tetratricopeptide repeat protein [Bryobacterales bacterium]